MKTRGLNQQAFRKYLSARNNYKRGQYKAAINKLIPLDMITKNDDVNHLLVKCLYYQKAYGDAEQVLLADVNSYTADESLIRLMINILLKNHEYIICREIITSFNDGQLKAQLLQQIRHNEVCFSKKYFKENREIAKHFYHLSGDNLIKQRVILRESKKLPLKMFLRIAKSLLIDPFLSPIMRLSILDVIRKMGLNIRLRYRWLDHKIYMINVNKLPNLTSTNSYHQIMKIVKLRYYHNPTQMLALKQNLRLDLSYLYPFNDQQIKSPQLWVDIAALRIQGKQPIFKNFKIKSIYHLQIKLNQLTKNLVQ